MTHILSSELTINFFKSTLIAIVLALSIVPIILLFTTADTSWIVMATLLWTIGSSIIFYPFMLYIYPHLITKMSVYILSLLLIIISVWFNISMITLLLPYDYIYYALFNATLNHVSLWGSLYIILLNTVITNFILLNLIDFYKEERLF